MSTPVYFVQPERSQFYPTGPFSLTTHKRHDAALTYTLDFEAFLDSVTISSVTHDPSGVTLTNTSNTTTQVSFRASGSGHSILTLTLSDGDTAEFRLDFVPTDLNRGADYGANL